MALLTVHRVSLFRIHPATYLYTTIHVYELSHFVVEQTYFKDCSFSCLISSAIPVYILVVAHALVQEIYRVNRISSILKKFQLKQLCSVNFKLIYTQNWLVISCSKNICSITVVMVILVSCALVEHVA